MSRLTKQQRFWKGHLEAAASERVTLTKYARRHGSSVHAMYTARQRIRDTDTPPPRSRKNLDTTWT